MMQMSGEIACQEQAHSAKGTCPKSKVSVCSWCGFRESRRLGQLEQNEGVLSDPVLTGTVKPDLMGSWESWLIFGFLL